LQERAPLEDFAERYIGIGISKTKLDVHILLDGTHFELSRDQSHN